jgi:hypothetical protein
VSNLEAQGVVSAISIAQMLGVTRQRVDQLYRTDPDFPEPVIANPKLRLWDRRVIEQWMAVHSPQAHREYVAWVLGSLQHGRDYDALSRYRMSLQLGMAASLGAKRGQDGRPSTVAEAHRAALADAKKADPEFEQAEPLTIECWAKETGRIA